MNTAVDCGKMYKSNLGSSRQASQYVLPHSLRLLPLFIIALLKSVSGLATVLCGRDGGHVAS